jgi:hypothetical protein
MVIFCKDCKTCQLHKTNIKNGKINENIPVKQHRCPKNYADKSSKSMEADAAIEMCLELCKRFHFRVYIDKFVSDDDATTRKNLNTQNNTDLPEKFKTPEFLADLNHRVKVIAKPLFGLAAISKSLSTCSKRDALRIKRNFSWYLKSGVRDETITFQEFYENRKAPIYHHFNTHQWCSSKWCWARRLDEEEEDELKKCQHIAAGEDEYKNSEAMEIFVHDEDENS